jgi:hypothetical protein
MSDRIVTPQEAQRGFPVEDIGLHTVQALLHTVATEPDRIRAAVAAALARVMAVERLTLYGTEWMRAEDVREATVDQPAQEKP